MYPDSTRRVPRRAKVCPLEIHGRQYILAIEKPLREIKKTYRTVSSSTIKVNDRRKSLCIRYVDRTTLECTSRSVSRVVSIMSVVFNGGFATVYTVTDTEKFLKRWVVPQRVVHEKKILISPNPNVSGAGMAKLSVLDEFRYGWVVASDIIKPFPT